MSFKLLVNESYGQIFNTKVQTFAELIWDALSDLVPFVLFKKLEKHPWRHVNFNKISR